MIILSIPYTQNWRSVVKVNDPDSIVDRVELRFDLGDIPLSSISDVFDSNCILTVRGNVEDKEAFIDYHVENSDCLFDLDFSVADNFSVPKERLIISYHDYSVESDFSRLQAFLSKYSHYSVRHIKTAVTIHNFNALLQVQKVLESYKGNLIFVGMGKLGKLTRILYEHLNSEAVYVGLSNKKTAPGQITLSELYRYYPVDKSTQIGGIIGGTQVQNSLGIDFYNAEFKKRKLNARYIPFVIDSAVDFWAWLNYQSLRTDFYGFSITMPAKKEIPRLLSHNKVANILLWKSKKFLNTDLDAFHRIEEMIKKLPRLPIVIYGNGASADNAVSVLTDLNLMVNGRDKEHIQEFSEKHSIPVFNDNSQVKYILINTTPLKPETLFDYFTGIEYLFNLSYPTGNQIDRRLLFTGEDFWQYQAQRQLKEFIKEIEGEKNT